MTAHEASPDWPLDKLTCTCSCATRGRAEVERLKGLLTKDRAREMEESTDEFIHAALDYIRRQERERCAKVAEEMRANSEFYDPWHMALAIAQTIRTTK